jgi:YfiH family protein
MPYWNRRTRSLSPTPRFLEPDWPAPDNVLALCTTRHGGHSEAPYTGLNLARHVGDSESVVVANRAILARALPGGCDICWLSQVHGIEVVQAGEGSTVPEADALWSRRTGLACAVMSADCLSVLLCSSSGDVVAAAHAGWRGLLAGVLEATVAAMRTKESELLAWLGPAIGPTAFEVGPEVRSGFLAAAAPQQTAAINNCFASHSLRPDHYFADLYTLARIRLGVLGVTRVFGGEFCTYSEPEHFYSYRRDGQTGRLACLIARQ